MAGGCAALGLEAGADGRTGFSTMQGGNEDGKKEAMSLGISAQQEDYLPAPLAWASWILTMNNRVV